MYKFFIISEYASEEGLERKYWTCDSNNPSTLILTQEKVFYDLQLEMRPSEKIFLQLDSSSNITGCEVYPENSNKSKSYVFSVISPTGEHSEVLHIYENGVKQADNFQPEIAEGSPIFTIFSSMGGYKKVPAVSLMGKELSLKVDELEDPWLPSSGAPKPLVFKQLQEQKDWPAPIYPQSKQTENPCENVVALMEDKEEEHPEVPEPSKAHRTLIVFYADFNSSYNFRERTARLLGSLNTPQTIKASAVTVADGKIYHGLTFKGGKAGGVDIEKYVDNYTQIVEVREGGK